MYLLVFTNKIVLFPFSRGGLWMMRRNFEIELQKTIADG
jgi:hypothetical protein